jgi:tetratricopeptide (TPR) repeat protein
LVGLYGAGGYGKSSTAAQVFKTVQGFGRTFWVNFQDPVNFGTFGRWMIRQFLGDDRYEQNRELYERCDDAELVNEVLSLLLKENCLLVLDNLETLFQDEALWNAYGEFLNGWLMGNGGGCLVLTSQFRLDLPMAKVWEWIGLRGLEVAQGVALLRAEQIVGEAEYLEAFVREADGHPLLLTLAVNLLKRREKDDFESPEILRLGQGDVDLLREIREAHRGDSEASVGKVLDLSFERLYPEWLRVLLWRSSVLRGQFGLAVAKAMMPDESVTLPEMRKLARWSFLLEQRQGEEWQFDILPLIRRYLKLGAKDSGNLDFAHEAAIGYFEANITAKPVDGNLEDCREELEIFHHACEIDNYQIAYLIYCTIDDFLDKRGFWTEQVRLLEALVLQWEKTDNNRQEIGACYCSIGNTYRSLGQYQRAIHFHQQHNEIAREISDRNGEANSLGNLGNAYYSLGQYQRAIDFHQQALPIQREVGNRQFEASSLGNLGNAYQSLGQYQRAIHFHQQHNEIAREMGDRQGEAGSLGNLGNAYQSLGQYQRAIHFHQQHNEIAREIGDRQGEASSLGNLGIGYQSLGQYQRAIEFVQQWNEIAREIGDRNGEARSLGGLGNAYQSLGQYQRAIDFHQQNNEIAHEIGDRQGEASSLGNLGNAYQSLGQYQRAIDFHQQNNEIAHEIGDRNGEASSLFNMALTFGKIDEYFNALQNFQQAKLIYEDLQLDHMVERCNEALGTCNQIIADERSSPPTIDQASKESAIEGSDREKQANQPIVRRAENDRKMNRIFYFCVGLVICFVVWKLKN